jgi:hypothetical protein
MVSNQDFLENLWAQSGMGLKDLTWEGKVDQPVRYLLRFGITIIKKAVVSWKIEKSSVFRKGIFT